MESNFPRGIRLADLRVFSPNKVLAEGIVLYSLDNLIAGKVFFSIDDIPESFDFITETGVLFRRTGPNEFLIKKRVALKPNINSTTEETSEAPASPFPDRSDDDSREGRTYQEMSVRIDEVEALGLRGERQAKIDKEEGKRKLLDSRPQNMVFISSTNDLTEDVKKELAKFGFNDLNIPKEHWTVFVSCLRFCTKKNFRPVGFKKYDDLNSPCPSHIYGLAEQMVTRDDAAGKYFRHTSLAGKGGFGKVFFAESILDGAQVAIKKMPHRTEKERRSNYLEIGYLIHCCHPNIVRLMSSYLIRDELWIAMEYMTGGTLSVALESFRFNEDSIAYISRELLKSLEFLHFRKIVHRDLKSANVMLTFTGQIKLIDFGLCADASKGPLIHMCGSPSWMAPEMIKGLSYRYTADIWSFAVVVSEMANGSRPEYGSRMKTMYMLATTGISLKNTEKWSDDFKDFFRISSLMDGNQRPQAADLLDHRFLKKAHGRKEMEGVVRSIFLTNVLTDTGLSF